MSNLTASQLVYHASGEPPHKYVEEEHQGSCATCASPLAHGVDMAQINNPTFSNHSEFFKFGTHVCRACAWMYGDPKRTHRNVLCVGDELWWPMISVESATDERPSWMGLLALLFHEPEDYPPGTPVTGVLTTDPKPRMWPRMRVGALGGFGLYVHAPDYDVSGWRDLDLGILRDVSGVVRDALLLGFAKTRIYHGLPGDYAKARKDPARIISLEEQLRLVRSWPEFVPALLATGVTKEEKATWKEKHVGNRSEAAANTGQPDGRGTPRGDPRQDDDRLF